MLEGLHKREEHLFFQALEAQGVTDYIVLQDDTRLRTRVDDFSPFEMHMILHSPPNRWFVYIQIEREQPVLVPISKPRAMAAVNS